MRLDHVHAFAQACDLRPQLRTAKFPLEAVNFFAHRVGPQLCQPLFVMFANLFLRCFWQRLGFCCWLLRRAARQARLLFVLCDGMWPLLFVVPALRGLVFGGFTFRLVALQHGEPCSLPLCGFLLFGRFLSCALFGCLLFGNLLSGSFLGSLLPCSFLLGCFFLFRRFLPGRFLPSGLFGGLLSRCLLFSDSFGGLLPCRFLLGGLCLFRRFLPCCFLLRGIFGGLLSDGLLFGGFLGGLLPRRFLLGGLCGLPFRVGKTRLYGILFEPFFFGLAFARQSFERVQTILRIGNPRR